MRSLEVNFSVDTSDRYVLDWLEGYLGQEFLVLQNWPYQCDFFYLRGFRRDSLGPVNADYLVNAGYYPDPKEKVMSSDNEFLAMCISTLRTADSRLSVSAQCFHPFALESFVTLLSKLAIAFQEADRGINPVRFGMLPYSARQRLSPPQDTRWQQPPLQAQFPLQGAPRSFIKRFKDNRYGVPSDHWRTTHTIPADLDFIRDFCALDNGWVVFLTPCVSSAPDGKLLIVLDVTEATLAGFSSRVPGAVEWEIDGPGTPNPSINLSCNAALSEAFVRPALLTIAALHPGIKDLVDSYLADLSSLHANAIAKTAMLPIPRQRGPAVATEERFKVFKQLKDQHPDWIQVQVAMEANRQQNWDCSEDTVRNTYRAMGEKWPRATKKR